MKIYSASLTVSEEMGINDQRFKTAKKEKKQWHPMLVKNVEMGILINVICYFFGKEIRNTIKIKKYTYRLTTSNSILESIL